MRTRHALPPRTCRCAASRWLARGIVQFADDRRQAPAAQTAQKTAAVALPNRADSLKFAVLGDFGTGERCSTSSADADGQRFTSGFPSSW